MNRHLKYSGALLAAFTALNFIIFFLIFVLTKTYSYTITQELIVLAIASVFDGLAITIIVISSNPVLKTYLNTFRMLLRLDTLSHPLLLRLQQEAPSTFQHSINIANLSNRAAKAIGADAFLARIGGYYHDIGKLINPDTYIENRKGEDDPLLDNSPKESAKLIIRHVKDGVKLAKEYDLPEEVIALIAQHHGTMPVSFFYNIAQKRGLKPNRTDYYYPGPKPLTKEASIIMLADAIESNVRSHETLTEEIIRETVEKMLDKRYDSGQFELSGLKNDDFPKIKKSFIEGIENIYHRRIKYPSSK